MLCYFTLIWYIAFWKIHKNLNIKTKRRHHEIWVCANVCIISVHPYHHNSWALASRTLSNGIAVCVGCFSHFFTCFLRVESWLCTMGFSFCWDSHSDLFFINVSSALHVLRKDKAGRHASYIWCGKHWGLGCSLFPQESAPQSPTGCPETSGSTTRPEFVCKAVWRLLLVGCSLDASICLRVLSNTMQQLGWKCQVTFIDTSAGAQNVKYSNCNVRKRLILLWFPCKVPLTATWSSVF